MAKPFSEQVLEFHRNNRGMAFVWQANMDDLEQKRQADRNLSAWLEYLEDCGHFASLKTWKFIANGGGKSLTFPTERPEFFDPGYVRRNYRQTGMSERAPNPDPVARRQIADKVRQAAAATRPPRDKRRGDYEAETAMPLSPAELGERFKREKPPLSSALRAKMGMLELPKADEAAA